MEMIVVLDLKSVIPAKEIKDLYDFLNENKAIRLNDLTFFIKTELSKDELMSKVSKVMSYGDKAHLIKSDSKLGYVCETLMLEPGEKDKIIN